MLGVQRRAAVETRGRMSETPTTAIWPPQLTEAVLAEWKRHAIAVRGEPGRLWDADAILVLIDRLTAEREAWAQAASREA